MILTYIPGRQTPQADAYSIVLLTQIHTYLLSGTQNPQVYAYSILLLTYLTLRYLLTYLGDKPHRLMLTQ